MTNAQKVTEIFKLCTVKGLFRGKTIE